MTLYIETSALLKLFLNEEGRREVIGAIEAEEDEISTSRVTRVEARAALAAAHRNRRISGSVLAAAKVSLDDLLEQFSNIDMSDALARLAGDVAETYRLRALDAIHLATALSVSDSELAFTTWDRALAAAARKSGLATAGIPG